MRIRHKPHARAELAAWPRFCASPADMINRWNELYTDSTAPLHLELGCGKGRFISTWALRQPNVNYLGVDIKDEVLLTAKHTAEKCFENAQKSPYNLMLTAYNIENIASMLSFEDNVERIYINFCNPWYKSGHAKHRLTHPRQLAQYRSLLPMGGEVHFKTDDAPLFKDSLRYFSMTGFEVLWQTHNLHKEEPASNVRTEHEDMFSAEGIPIKFCVVKKVPAELDLETISHMKDI